MTKNNLNEPAARYNGSGKRWWRKIPSKWNDMAKNNLNEPAGRYNRSGIRWWRILEINDDKISSK